MMTAASEAYRQIVDDVARNLATTVHLPEGSFIRTPLLYPGGSSIVIRIHPDGDEFIVSDAGDGYREAELMGTVSSYMRHAPMIAERAGVAFDRYAFVVLHMRKEQLVGAVMAVANCALEAVQEAAFRLSERRSSEAAERLYMRLVRVFSAASVQRDVQVLGASNRRWQVASLVQANKHEAVFEPVSQSHSSVYATTTKFHDLARRVNSPARIAVVRDKRSFNGEYINLLSQAAKVVDENIPDEILAGLPKAA